MGIEMAREAAELLPIGPPAVGASNGHEVLKPGASSDDLATSTSRGIRLCLMHGFSLSYDRVPVTIPLSAQRVAAFVALRNRPALRPYVAETLWLDATQDRAMGNLRSALWRLRQAGAEIIESTGDYLSLGPDVAVDVLDFVVWSRRLITESDIVTTVRIEDVTVAGDLLPDWYDDWVVIERERLRQLRLHALERACLVLTMAGEYGRAIEAGLAAITEEPLHESGHVALIKAHLGEGNRAEAIRQYDAYVRLMRDELGLDASPSVTALVGALLAPDTSGRPQLRAVNGDAAGGDTPVMIP